jgi:hypothetical protein
MSIEFISQYLSNLWSQNKEREPTKDTSKKTNKETSKKSDKENSKKVNKGSDKNPKGTSKENNISKKCFFKQNLKFIEDFKEEFTHHSIDYNLYQLIIEICSYVNNIKHYAYDYIIYDINSFFDLYNKNPSDIDNNYLIEFIHNIKNNFCLNKELIDKINSIIESFEYDDNVTSPDFEEEGFEFEKCYFKNNPEFKDNLEIEDIEYRNCNSYDDY